MSANLEAKKLVVEEIKTKIQNSKSVVLVKFEKLTVAEDTEIRRELRKNDVEYKVLKNSIIKHAFNDLGINDFDSELNGPTSVAFGSDEVSAAKVIVESAKKYEGKVEVKSAYFENKRIDANAVKNLASIPTKQQLYGMLASALIGLPRALAVALNQVAEKNA